MIGVFVRFRYSAGFDDQMLRNVAEGARPKFEAMPGLRSKVFTIDRARREATNFYLWDSEEAAKAFYTDELLDRITSLYGVRPSVEFVEIAALVDNGSAR